MHNFKELKVWNAGIELTKAIFKITRSFPAEEKYTLTSQMIRAAISIPSNIAEGCGRKSDKEFHQFLNISIGSAFELETQLIIANEFNYLSLKDFDELTQQIIEIQKMVHGLKANLIRRLGNL